MRCFTFFIEMIVFGTAGIEWKTDLKTCLTKGVVVGHAGAASAPALLEDNQAGCVAWTNTKL